MHHCDQQLQVEAKPLRRRWHGLGLLVQALGVVCLGLCLGLWARARGGAATLRPWTPYLAFISGVIASSKAWERWGSVSGQFSQNGSLTGHRLRSVASDTFRGLALERKDGHFC